MSRAYYATHHLAHHWMQSLDQTPPPRGTWKHYRLPNQVASALADAELASLIRDAYELRRAADYRPDEPVEAEQAQAAISLMGNFLTRYENAHRRDP